MAELIERDAALAYIDCCLGNSLGGRKEFDSGLMQARKFVTIIPAVNRWIPCSERLPEQERMVIVCCYGSDVIIPDYSRGESIEEAIQRIGAIPHVTTGFCDEEGWCGADMFPMMVQPTFWMPLPEPPEKE